MGFHIRPLLIAAPLLLAAPVHAQQTEQPGGAFQLPPTATPPAPNPNQPNPNQQGPELNVFRDPVTPRAAPPVVAPTVTPPPATVQPTPAPAAQPSRPRPAPAPVPAEPRANRQTPTPAPAQARPAPEPTSAATPAPVTDDSTDNSNAPATPPAQQLPVPATNAVEEPEPATAPSPPAKVEDGLSFPWIVGGLLALIVVAAALLLRRRRAIPPQATEPAAPPPPTPRLPVHPPVPPAPELVAARDTPVAADTDRPWLGMDLGVTQARYSVIGVTITYLLILHNRGDRTAQDVLVRGMLGNGGAQQQDVLQRFFTGADGMPLHSAVSIAPGETIQLTGELRLSPDQIVPVEMGQRSLLIPLAAFDAAYRWGSQDGDPEGHGRTARAFIVGQEQEPPADRLAPLRLDQGPRQYRRPAARAAAELAPA